MNQWQPMSTAPKDGTRILIAFGNQVHMVCWYEDIWCVDDNKNELYPFRGYRDNDGPCAPRGWMPAPEPPPEASE